MAQTRSLLIGASGPVGYDYTREEVDGVPYPVLEDLWGILLCYDELWFLSRAFCPRDMWELPYVRFIDEMTADDVDLTRLRTASEQLGQVARGLPYGPVDVSFGSVVSRVTGDANGVDNHSRGVQMAEDWWLSGNAGDFELLAGDMGIAAALDLPRLDVLNNSIGAARLTAQTALASTFLGDQFGPWHVDVAQELATLRVPNRYEPGRTYVPDIEELRAHPNIEKFREMLSGADWTAAEAVDAAAEISDLADRFARRHVARTFRVRPWYQSVAKIAVGPVGNLVHPGLGTVANGGVKVLDYGRGRDDRRIGGWAAFVASLQK